MKQNTIIFTKEDLTILKANYDFLFQSEGILNKETLSYKLGINKLYFEPTIVFKQQGNLKKEPFQSRSRYADVHLIFCYGKALEEYRKLLEAKSKVETVPLSIQKQLKSSNYRTDFILKMPDGLSWKFEYLNIGSCGKVTNRSCQSCDSGCMASFGADLSQQNLDVKLIYQLFEAYFNEDWIKKH